MTLFIIMEEWRDVPGYEGYYQVSNLGQVRSLTRTVKGRNGFLKPATGKILKYALRKGYPFVRLSKLNCAKMCSIHRLVWEAFNGPIPEGMQVNHINEVKTDNRLENLNLLTPFGNHMWGTCVQRAAKSKSKPVNQYNLDGSFVKTWSSMREAADKLGLSRGHISSCCKGRYGCKTCGNFIWRYA